MIINQNILAILRTFLQKRFMRNFTPRRQLLPATTEFLSKIPTERKYLMNNLTFVRRKYLYMRS